jgi:hypothetical protein
MIKPIRVFWSPLSRRFYASRSYKEIKSGIVEITGEKFDVTQDIAAAIMENGVTFTEVVDKVASTLSVISEEEKQEESANNGQFGVGA